MNPGVSYLLRILATSFLICLASPIFLFAQQKTIDSLNVVISKSPDDTLKLDLMYSRNKLLIIDGQNEKVLQHLDETQEFANRLVKKYPKAVYDTRLKSETARIQNMKGVVYYRQSKYPEALESYFTALRAREALNDKRGIAMACNNIYGVYAMLSDGPNQLKYLEKAISNFEAVGDKTGLGQAYYNQSLYYYKLGQYEKAVETNLKALNYSEAAGDKISVTHCLLHSGVIYNHLTNHEKALEYFIRALKLTDETGDKIGMVYVHTNMGAVYRQIKEYDKAFDEFRKAMEISIGLGNQKHIADTWFQLGITYSVMIQVAETFIDTLKARVYADSSISNFMRAQQLYEKLDEKGEHANTLMEIGDLLTYRREYEEAGTYIQRGLHMAEQSGERNDRSKAYRLLSVLYEEQGKPEEALRYHKMYSSLKDSLLNENSTKTILELDRRFESERKEKQISLLEKQSQIDQIELKLQQEQIHKQDLMNRDKSQQLLLVSKGNEIKDLSLQRQQIELAQRKTEFENKQSQVNILQRESDLQQLSLQKASQQQQFAIVGIIALLLFGGFTYYRYRQTNKLSECLSDSLQKLKKTQQQLIDIEKRREQEKIRLRISHDIHDEIGSNLTKISLLSEMVMSGNGTVPATLKKSVSDIAHYAQEVNDSLSEIVWAVNPGQDTLESLLAYMRNHIHSFLKDTGIDYEINFPEVSHDVDLDAELKRSIYLVMKESLNNAVKYSKAKKIKINFSISDPAFTLKVTDDGIGFDPSITDRFGNGLHNMQYRMQQCGCSLMIISSPGKGCEIKITGNLKRTTLEA